ncbi:beta-1,6-N-acetylglucosaminyltransferase [Aeromonas sp. A-5]|uniref:beta-1,6-N-acetylglucosaminyltransferase n=1 Tax=Aeromonas ichthyocola TaxID=3367746 RepID=UPI0038DC6244
MIAYLILVHRYPDQFKRLFKAIYHHSNHYLIHVDKRSGPELQQEIADFLTDYPNAAMLPSKNALWGGYSLVDAELRGIAALLEHHHRGEPLSAQDFRCAPGPCSQLLARPQRHFLKVLREPRRDLHRSPRWNRRRWA